MKVALLSINLGAYKIFWKEFYESAENNFLPDASKEYFVFTDAKSIEYAEEDNVHVIPGDDMGWPYNSMRRFLFFLSIRDALAEFDYVFFANANAKFIRTIKMEMLLSQKNIITVEHPGWHGKPIEKVPFERRKESRACVSLEEGKIYVQGAFLGGKSKAFLQMCEYLADVIEQDISDGVIAVYHDESFLNRYIIGRSDVQILGRQYLTYEEFVYPYDPIIMLRDKRKYIGNDNGRFYKQNYNRLKIALFLRNVKWAFLIKSGFYKWENYKDDDGNYLDLDISERIEAN